MKFKIYSLPRSKSFFAIPFILLVFVVFSINSPAQTPQLSLVDIFTALRSTKATLPEKNNILSEGVKQRGITFSLSLVLEKELRKAGANDNLIIAIREKNPVVKPPVKQPVKPTPKPTATPRPKDFAYFQNRANSSFVLGEYDSAIKNYTEAIKLKDDEPNPYFSRGLALYKQKQYTRAIIDFDKFIEITPTESMAYFYRGDALQEIGKFEKALVDFKKASELDPENEQARKSFLKLEADLKPLRKPDPISNTEAISREKIVEKPAETEPLETDKPVYVGPLQILAVKLAMPRLSNYEKRRAVSGVVAVQVTIDKKGNVISAKATSGPVSLWKTSENAALDSKFKPHLVNGVAVSATGFINYNFKSN
jgi:tetratricopeptide (TPR) repeat protein